MCDSGRTERPLSITTNSQNGALGEEGFYSHSSSLAGYEKTSV